MPALCAQPPQLTVDLGTVNLSGIVNGLLDTVTAASLDSINDALGLPLSVLGVVAIPRITLLSELDAVLDNPLLAAVVGTVSGTIDAAVQLVDDVTAIANLPGIGAVNLNDADLGAAPSLPRACASRLHCRTNSSSSFHPSQAASASASVSLDGRADLASATHR